MGLGAAERQQGHLATQPQRRLRGRVQQVLQGSFQGKFTYWIMWHDVMSGEGDYRNCS